MIIVINVNIVNADLRVQGIGFGVFTLYGDGKKSFIYGEDSSLR